MGEQQAGLCLSCGVPFLPDVSKIQFFNREGVMSILFLNTEYLENRDIQEMFYHPRFTSQRNQAHMFHESHHATAIDYMCNRHNDDDDVGQGFVPAPGAVVPNQNSAPFLYYRAPTSKTRKDARAGVWPKPAQDQRLNFKRLRRYIQESAGLPSCEALNHNLKQMYTTCRSCNALMTQQADIRFLLGYSPAGTKNDLGPVISQSHINEYPVDAHREPLERGYNTWSIKNPIPAFVGPHPVQDRNDSDAAHVAYYLHMCLPFQAPGANNFFVTHFADPNLRHSARSLYIEQSWIALEIAAIATLIEQGKVAADDPKRSHGMHQHYGILDLYVSYFMFRLIQFRFGRNMRRNGLNFVQWHQKYFCEALDCMDLYEPKENRGILGQRMYGTTYQDSKKLIVQICNRIVKELTTKLDPLVQLVTSRPNVPHGISEFFVPVEVLTVLRDRSRQSVATDFQMALGKFGVNALMHRITRLCKDYPKEFYNQLLSFRSNWQWLEINRVRSNSKALTSVAAYRQYHLCLIMDAPDELPESKEETEILFEEARYCSYWNAVLALDNIGALQEDPVD